MSGFPRHFKTGEPVRDSSTDEMWVQCRPCSVCGRAEEVLVERVGYERWVAGALIQDALLGLPLDKRELLISGTHADCWERLFSFDEDD